MSRIAPRKDPRPHRRGVPTPWLAVCVVAVSISNAAAQKTALPSYVTDSPVTDSLAASVDPAKIRTAKVTALAAMVRVGNIAGAVDSYRSLNHDAALSPAQRTQVNAVGKRLVDMGIDATLLNTAPPTLGRMPRIPDAIPMDEFDLAAAPGLPNGQTPNVGSPSTPQPSPASLIPISPDATASNSATPQTAMAGGVAQVQYAVPNDTPGSVTNTDVIEDIAVGGPGINRPGVNRPGVTDSNLIDAAGRNDSPGLVAYRRGMELLTTGDKSAARAAFLEAFKYQNELPEAERNLLKDKLTLLSPRRLAPPTASPGDNARPMTVVEKAEAESQSRTRRLYREVTSELATIEKIKTSEPLEAQSQLETLRRRVGAAEVEDQARAALIVMVDRAISSQKRYVENNRANIELELENESVRTQMRLEDERTVQIDEEVSALVDDFNNLMRDKRYPEAETIAKQVAALKPSSSIATSMLHVSRMGTRLQINNDIQLAKEDGFVREFSNVNEAMTPMDTSVPLVMPDATHWERIRESREGTTADSIYSESELRIRDQLSSTVSVQYANEPLGEVLDDLSALADIPVVADYAAMATVGVTLDTPVNFSVNHDLRLQSVLNLTLEPIGLTYVIRDDVLLITSIENKRSKTFEKAYPVGDLVMPITNSAGSYDDGLAGAIRAAYQATMPQARVQLAPVSMMGGPMASAAPSSMVPQTMVNPAAFNTGGNASVLGQYSPMGGGIGAPPSMGNAVAGGGSLADFSTLMQLIQTTIEPDTWEALGGNSTMFPYAQNLSLVVSTTSDVHDQIVDLLESLRRLQNLQIAIEVRFITLSDDFAENIGVDFDLQFDDNLTDLPTDDAGPSVSIGIDANNVFTDDFDIQINQDLATTPPFGAALSPATSIGFAILSDIEAYFFLSAAQASTRSNVMQAPKVVMFDGQSASIQDQSQTPFVISVTPVVGDFAVAQQPVIVVLNEGTQLNVQGVVSDDKRFVRLTLVPFFSQITDVDTFTFNGSRSSRSSSRDETDTNGDGIIDDNDEVDTTDDEDIVQGTTVQLPTFAFTTVNTTVSVPDGGTILLGGIKRQAEGRAENGVPVLSKIPYVNRLFRNQAMGRTSSSLMLMVTPRIIIQEEEELAQTGFLPDRN